MLLIEIANDGQMLAGTTYWQTEHASAGMCYLSGNAGAWRLLVPEAAEGLLAEMHTGRTATIEPSLHIAGNWDVVFDDGTDSPFSIALSPGQIDRALDSGPCRLTVWTEAGGRVIDLTCEVLP